LLAVEAVPAGGQQLACDGGLCGVLAGALDELAVVVGVDPSILVTLLNPLEADGLVTRERDRGDRRRHLVTLTPAGERHLASASRAPKHTEDALFASLDDDQREHLRALLLVLRDGLAADAEVDCTT
jgi:DNA-binding MarR family transcriptional regulator